MPILIQVIVFISITMILVPLAKRIGIPPVLGYLISGMLLGPGVLHIIADTSQLTPLMHYATILLLFMIGLEFRPQRLWQMQQALLLLGTMQILLCAVILGLLLYWFFSLALNLSLFFGCALAFSSTVLLLPILAHGQQGSLKSHQHSIALLVLHTATAMLLIALFPIGAGLHSAHQGLAYSMAILATFSGLFLLSRYLIQPLLGWIAKSGTPELLSAVALVVLLGILVIMDAMAISPLLGAFWAGMLLANSEFQLVFETRIQPFKGIVVGLFFVMLGMSMSAQLGQQPYLLLLMASLCLLCIKLLCISTLAYYYKNSLRTSLQLGVNLAQGGELACVLFFIAYQHHLLSAQLYTSLALIVCLSMFSTPALLTLYARYNANISANKDGNLAGQSITQQQHVLIAGFGRVGQIVARIAHLQQIPYTVIDNNLDNIDFIRHYAGQVYYGDATAADTLEHCALHQAKLLVIAIDDVEDSLNLARHVRLHHPELPILARARDRHHVYLLKAIGVRYIWRETYLSALAMAEQMLLLMGCDTTTVQRQLQAFSTYDEQLLQNHYGIYSEAQKTIESHQEMLQELKNLFENDQFVQQHARHHSQNQPENDMQQT